MPRRLAELQEFLGTSAPPVGLAGVEVLSPREVEVLELVAAGLTNQAIAEN